MTANPELQQSIDAVRSAFDQLMEALERQAQAQAVADLPAWLHVNEVAELLKLDLSTVYRMIKSGELPSVKVGANVRVPRGKLTEWMESRDSAQRAPTRSQRTQRNHRGLRAISGGGR